MPYTGAVFQTIPDNTHAADPRPIANGDQECWVMDRIETAMLMAIALYNQKSVRADEHQFDYGLRGIAEGAAVEIIHTLGMRPDFVNLRRPRAG